jgi:hypothetical protein
MSAESDEPAIISPSEPRKLLFAKEVAARWRISTQSLAMWRERGYGPQWFRIGDNIRYLEDSVIEFEQAAQKELEAKRDSEPDPGAPTNPDKD